MLGIENKLKKLPGENIANICHYKLQAGKALISKIQNLDP